MTLLIIILFFICMYIELDDTTMSNIYVDSLNLITEELFENIFDTDVDEWQVNPSAYNFMGSMLGEVLTEVGYCEEAILLGERSMEMHAIKECHL